MKDFRIMISSRTVWYCLSLVLLLEVGLVFLEVGLVGLGIEPVADGTLFETELKGG